MVPYLVQHYLENSLISYPDRVSASCGDSKITYKELSAYSNQVANCLIENGVARQDRVVFCMKRSTDCIVSIFGILKADAIYVPIDPKSPAQRVKHILDDSEPSAIICDSTTLDTLFEILTNSRSRIILIVTASAAELNFNVFDISSPRIICRNQIKQYGLSRPAYKNIDTDTAYILYTSGSTGKPKGVMISHLNITNYINWAVDCFDITVKDRLLNTAPFHFDMSTFEIYCAVKSGAALCIAQEIHLLFPNKLMHFIEEQKITIWKAISSLIMYLANTDALKSGRIPTLKKVLFGGEILPTKYLIKWMQTYPEKTFFNVYGPTETTGISTYFKVEEIPDDGNISVPIGKACANSEVYLLGKDNLPVDVGSIGMLYIRGSSLSKGYWGDMEKTEKEFITNPFTKISGDRLYRTRDLARLRSEGMYEFMGRQDTQIKHMGYRIELSEIEKVLLAINYVNDATVIPIDSKIADIFELAAFVELKGSVGSECIIEELERILPRYMLPKYIFSMCQIPRTDRGKIDRVKLQEYYTRSN